jgi:hypothetical protein
MEGYPLISLAIPMFLQAFKNVDNVLLKGAGCTSQRDDAEQLAR